jgi:hypothetical protein
MAEESDQLKSVKATLDASRRRIEQSRSLLRQVEGTLKQEKNQPGKAEANGGGGFR